MPLPARPLLIPEPTIPAHGEETQVPDPRAALSPSQQVEQRVTRLLANAPVFVSQMQRQLNRGAR